MPSRLEIEIGPAIAFQSRDSRKISWNPIRVVAAPDPQRLAALQALAETEQEHQAQLEAEQRAQEQSHLLEASAPNPKNTKKVVDLPSGKYLCRRYASTTFRGAPLALPSSSRRGRRASNGRGNAEHFLKREIARRYAPLSQRLFTANRRIRRQARRLAARP